MTTKWLGAAAWSAREAHAGDRLPYARLVDEHTLLLRDGSLMSALQVPGLLFETEDTEALNAHAITREVMLRSNLDARFVLYHHVIRRRVSVELEASFDDPLAAHIDRRWREKVTSGSALPNGSASSGAPAGASRSRPTRPSCARCARRCSRSPLRSASTARSRSGTTSARAGR
jgi:hypothetical protein